MATIVTPLTDGGRVEVQWASGGEMRVQKFDASGAPVGNAYVTTPLVNTEPDVVALANGGFVVVTGFVMKGAVYGAYVFDANGAHLTTVDPAGGGIGLEIAASPDGGFLIASMERRDDPAAGPGGTDYTWHPYLTLYDNAGAVVHGPQALTGGELPTVTVQADGDYLVQWTDGGVARTLEIDPQAPQGPAPAAGQVLTSDQYADVLQGGSGADTLNAGQGPDILSGGGGADLFVFADTPWNAGRVTDFALGSDRIDLTALFRASGYAGADPVADGYVRFAQSEAGAVVLYDTDGPAAGNTIWFNMTTLDGVSANGLTWAQVSGSGSSASPPPPPPPPPSPAPTPSGGEVLTSDQYGDVLQGGAGNDTLNAGQGPDQLTGAGGADLFVFGAFPWNAGRIADFTPGVDRLDLSALFDQSGYTGTDPIADGRLEFRPDGQGDTQVYVDRDGPGVGDWPFLITTLQGVTPAQVGAGDWIV